jgi:hypothetical protein
MSSDIITEQWQYTLILGLVVYVWKLVIYHLYVQKYTFYIITHHFGWFLFWFMSQDFAMNIVALWSYIKNNII